jgi:hypothetical protein
MTRTPDRAAHFDPEDLTRILHEGGGLSPQCRVLTVTCEPIDGGYLSGMVRLRLGYHHTCGDADARTGGAPRSVVLKRPAHDELPRTIGTAMGMYAREVHLFYRRVAPRLDVSTPRCFHADLDELTGEFTLVLEHVSGASVHAQDDACSEPDLLLALDQAAGLHASHWNDPTLAEADWLIQLTAPGVRPWHELYQQAWQAFQGWDGVSLPRVLKTLGDGLANGSIDTWIGSYEGPWTIAHADFHIGNLLYRKAAMRAGRRHAVVVDWQLATHASPLVDVAFLLGRMPTEYRRSVEPRMLAAYHERLQERGIAGYSLSACRRDYARWLWFGVLNAVIASAAYPISPEELPRHVEKVERFLTQASTTTRCATSANRAGPQRRLTYPDSLAV